MQIDFVIGPLKLADHPQRAGHGGEHPEDIAAPVRSTGVQEQPGVGQQRNQALRNVAEGVQRPGRVSGQRNGGVDPQEQQEDSGNPDVGAGRGHDEYP